MSQGSDVAMASMPNRSTQYTLVELFFFFFLWLITGTQLHQSFSSLNLNAPPIFCFFLLPHQWNSYMCLGWLSVSLSFKNRLSCCGTRCSPRAEQEEGTSKRDAAVLLSLVNETVPGYVKGYLNRRAADGHRHTVKATLFFFLIFYCNYLFLFYLISSPHSFKNTFTFILYAYDHMCIWFVRMGDILIMLRII